METVTVSLMISIIKKESKVYSAKIKNYKKGNAFRDPYYIDKNGNKRSYMSYKEMPVEAQMAEKARAKTKQTVKKVAGVAVSAVGSAAVAVGAAWIYKTVRDRLS